MNRISRFELCLVVLVWLGVLAFWAFCARPAHGWPLGRGGWRPTLIASIDKTTIKPGETVTVTYQCGNGATACRANVSHWAMIVGKSDGELIPLEGKYTVTPTEVGELVTNITAYKRAFDLNRSGGPDGRRRTETLWFKITVTK